MRYCKIINSNTKCYVRSNCESFDHNQFIRLSVEVANLIMCKTKSYI